MLLDSLLTEYLQTIERAMLSLENVYIERYEEEVLASNRLNLRIRIRFFSRELLEINEAIIVKNAQLKHFGYRYHFQDKENNMIFRYDNTPHFPSLKTFPDHKHVDGKVIESNAPILMDVITEVVNFFM